MSDTKGRRVFPNIKRHLVSREAALHAMENGEMIVGFDRTSDQVETTVEGHIDRATGVLTITDAWSNNDDKANRHTVAPKPPHGGASETP